MEDEAPDELLGFVGDVDPVERSLVVANRTRNRPLARMLDSMFEGQPVDVEERRLEGYDDDVVLLVEGGDVVATSPLDALERSILLINSDLYVTSQRSIETVDPPDVLTELTDTPFRLRGYPEAHKEKLLLIVMSRYVEQLALQADGGTLRTAFQELSRMNDERGTRAAYERLADSDVDVHVYGVPDWVPPPTFDVTTHAGYGEQFRTYWFVVYTPPDGDDHAAMVAVEVEPDDWVGLWTFDPDRVERINRYLERAL